MWNNRRSWCIQAGSPCLGCCEANPNDPGDNWVEVNTPFYIRHRDLRIGGVPFQPTTISWIAIGAVAAVMVIHGIGMKAKGNFGLVETEEVREWDAKHPNEAIGKYDESVLKGKAGE
jgi:hydrogenase small subunit